MELCLSLGDDHQAPEEPFGLISSSEKKPRDIMITKTTEFCMGLSIGPSCGPSEAADKKQDDHQVVDVDVDHHRSSTAKSQLDVPVQLDLLPWPIPSDHKNGGGVGGGRGCSSELAGGLDVINRVEEVSAASSSPTNSGGSSFQMDIGLYGNCRGGGDRKNYKRGPSVEGDEGERASNSRASDEDDIINGNASCRKKLRLSKEQSAFLEESFKEHHTLNPKQKLALAKQLNLRPRQVEVWFQNRRARTKLKQTEVDCEFLKRCCETLTEENRRLNKELQELRALKIHHSNPFYMQSPATTLTMCPSCERIAATTTTNTNRNLNNDNNNDSTSTTKAKAAGLPLSRPRFYPFSQPQSHQSSAAS